MPIPQRLVAGMSYGNLSNAYTIVDEVAQKNGVKAPIKTYMGDKYKVQEFNKIAKKDNKVLAETYWQSLPGSEKSSARTHWALKISGGLEYYGRKDDFYSKKIPNLPEFKFDRIYDRKNGKYAVDGANGCPKDGIVQQGEIMDIEA